MDSLMKYVARTARLAALFRGERLEQYGLNAYQHIYIITVCDEPGINQDQLAKIIYVNKSNVARQLACLEQNGFVTRVPGKTDRRQMEVYPTEKAKRVYPYVVEVLQEWNTRLMEDFSEEQQAQLISMMEAVMNKALETADKDRVK